MPIIKKHSWEDREEEIKKPRKRRKDKAKKMRVSGKGVFKLAKEMAKKKQDTRNK